jgi:hypothetical protein
MRTPNPDQVVIDAGEAALRELPGQIIDLAITVAREMALEGEDWRECLPAACEELTTRTQAEVRRRMHGAGRRQLGLRLLVYSLRQIATSDEVTI